jgi:hypothetical protein
MLSAVHPTPILEGRFYTRAATRDDAEALYAIFSQYWEAMAGRAQISLDEI